MKVALSVTIVWIVVIVGLVALEVAELTHFFRLPIEAALGDPLTFIFSLVFTTIVAIIGAIFVGIYISQRLLSGRGFTPFEEEMLRMHSEIREMRGSVEEIRRRIGRAPADPGPDPPRGDRK